MNRGLVHVTIHFPTDEKWVLGWVARSAIHRAIKAVETQRRRDGVTYPSALFYIVRGPSWNAVTQQYEAGGILGVGKPTGPGWTRSAF